MTDKPAKSEDDAFRDWIAGMPMGCTGSCAQGRKPCPHPLACLSDDDGLRPTTGMCVRLGIVVFLTIAAVVAILFL